MLRDVKAGAGYVLTGSKLIVKPSLRRFVFVPLLINVVLFAVGISYAIPLFGAVIQGWLPAWLRWLDWLMWPLFGIIVFGVVFFRFSLVANLIAAPSTAVSPRPWRRTCGASPRPRRPAGARRCGNSSRASARSFAA